MYIYIYIKHVSVLLQRIINDSHKGGELVVCSPAGARTEAAPTERFPRGSPVGSKVIMVIMID